MATAFAPSDIDVPASRLRGGQSTYSIEIRDKICRAVASAKGGLRTVLENDPELPSFETVVDWLDKHADLALAFAHARDTQLKAMAHDIIDISDSDALDPGDKRIMVDTRKWLLSKLIPKTYGDKLDVTTDGQAMQSNSVNIDQRIQSIMMQAAARAGRAPEDMVLSDEAMRLLE